MFRSASSCIIKSFICLEALSSSRCDVTIQEVRVTAIPAAFSLTNFHGTRGVSLGGEGGLGLMFPSLSWTCLRFALTAVFLYGWGDCLLGASGSGSHRSTQWLRDAMYALISATSSIGAPPVLHDPGLPHSSTYLAIGKKGGSPAIL